MIARLTVAACALFAVVLGGCGAGTAAPGATEARATPSAIASPPQTPPPPATPSVAPSPVATVTVPGTACPADARCGPPPATPATTPCGPQNCDLQGGVLAGRVQIGPTCPVERIDSPCPDRPYEADITILDASGAVVARTRSAADGTFSVTVPAGTYAVHAASNNRLPTAPRDQTVTIQAYATTSITITYDSGIR